MAFLDRGAAVTASARERILFVAREFTLGGAAYLAVRHAERLASRFDIDLLVAGPCEESMLGQLPDEVSVFRIDPARLRSKTDALGCLELILAHHHEAPFQRQYRAVLATSVFPGWQACLAVSLARAPRKLLFLVDEGLRSYPGASPRDQSIVDSCLMAADLVLPVSRRLWHRMAEGCPRLAQRPWHVLRPPLAVDRPLEGQGSFSPTWERGGTPLVLTVARLTSDKQILQCLQAHHRLRRDGLDFRWYVIGAGPEEGALRREIARLGMADAFFLPGRQPDVRPWMRQCDVFAHFSSSEGCPTVVMEALLAGCAVVMTDVNGAEELIDHGRTGLIVANDPEAMAEGLSRLVRDEGLRDRFRRCVAEGPPVSDPIQETAWLMARIDEPVPVPGPPQVSILVPAFNHEGYVDRAIASALMQDFPSLEVVVVDDASTDRTGLLAASWCSDPRFRYVRNEHNLGRVANYRKALTDHARGEWVLMLDGDDHLVDPGFIRQAWQELQHHAGDNVVFAQAGHRVRHVNGEHADVDIAPPIDGPVRLMAGGDYLRFVYETGFFTHLGALYRRQAAIDHGFYTADISSSDMDSLLRLALEGNVLLLNTIAGCWVQHGTNASSNVDLDEIAANVRIFRQITRMAVKRELTSMSRISGALTDYEARTLAFLFNQTLGKSARGPLSVLKMLAIVLSVNPRLLLNHRVASSCRRSLRKLTRLTARRCLSSLWPGRARGSEGR